MTLRSLKMQMFFGTGTDIAKTIFLFAAVLSVSPTMQVQRKSLWAKDEIIPMPKDDKSPTQMKKLARDLTIDFPLPSEMESDSPCSDAPNLLLATFGDPALNPPVGTCRWVTSTPAIGTLKEDSKDGLKYVWIPQGTYQMGCSPDDNECHDEEKPRHRVRISKGFWFGHTPVTVKAYKRFSQGTGKTMPPEPSILGRALNGGWSNEAMPIV